MNELPTENENELFDNYAQDFHEQVLTINLKLEETKDLAEKHSSLLEIHYSIRNLDNLISKMEALIYEGKDSVERLRQSLTSCRRDLDRVRKQYHTIKSEDDRKILIQSDDEEGDEAQRNDPRQALLKTKKILQSGEESLTNSLKIIDETEKFGKKVLSNLSEQKEKIVSSHNRLEDMETNLGISRRILNAFERRQGYIKLTIICLIICIVFMIALIVYYSIMKLFR